MADYYFNFPAITSLTIAQQAALNEAGAIALTGGPGTGKSFVSLWRHISNHQRQNPIKSQLLTFTTSLAYYLKASSASQSKNAADYVDSTKNWYYKKAAARAEIIIDEAQDMPLNLYEDEDKLRQFSKRLSYGADNKQILNPNAFNFDRTYNLSECSPEEELHRIYKNKIFSLDKNFRNTKRILEFAKIAFSDAIIPISELNSCKEVGEKPSFLLFRNIAKQNEAIINIISQFSQNEGHNIGILTPLANKPWEGGEIYTARYYYDIINNYKRPDGSNFECSYYDWTMNGMNKMKNIHITPFKSAKGLEFDTVILPCFDPYKLKLNVVTWRHYFVAVTRAKSNLYLFSQNDMPNLKSVIDKQEI